jgi:predicted transcriptional regulator
MRSKTQLSNSFKRGYFKVPNSIFDYGLSIAAFAIFCEMLSEKEEFNPSVTYLSNKLGLSRSSIHRSIQELLDRNFIKLVSKGGLGRVSVYEFTSPKQWRKNVYL